MLRLGAAVRRWFAAASAERADAASAAEVDTLQRREIPYSEQARLRVLPCGQSVLALVHSHCNQEWKWRQRTDAGEHIEETPLPRTVADNEAAGASTRLPRARDSAAQRSSTSQAFFASPQSTTPIKVTSSAPPSSLERGGWRFGSASEVAQCASEASPPSLAG